MSAVVHPTVGALVAWWRGNDLAFAVVAAEEKQRVTLVGPDGREDRVPGARLAFEIEPAGPIPGKGLEGRRLAGERAAAAGAQARSLAEGVDVAVVWELTRESGRLVSDSDIADLALSARTAPARAAAILALLADGLHFVRKPDGWEARAPDAVEEIRREREISARRHEEKRRAHELLSAVGAGGPFVPEGTEIERRYLAALEALAVFEDGAPADQRDLAFEALEASRLPFDRPHEGAFLLLRRTGRFASDDENLEIPRFGLRTQFPAEAIAGAAASAARGFERAGREDLTGLEIVTVDGPRTVEIDDALGIEDLGGGRLRIGIHIADPSVFVASGDAVDREALLRATTHYFPDRRIPMLPESISEGAASLVVGEERPALSFLAEIEETGAVAAWTVVPSIVRARARFSYDDADRAIETGDGPFGETLRRLFGAAQLRETARATAGALRLSTAQAEIHVDPGGTIVLERRDAGSPSRLLVSEAMVLAGELAARFCIERDVPGIFRRQAPPAARHTLPEGVIADPVAARAIRRVLRRGEAGLKPGAHFALGLPAYAQATSPLRRFQDLAVHRQILGTLRDGRPPYDSEELQRIAATTEAADADARRAERSRDRYWLLRWFAERTGNPFEGTVVETSPRTVVFIDATVSDEVVPGLAAEVGDRVTVQVVRSNPRAGILVLR